MKIVLPENKSEITLSQYQRYSRLISKEDTDLNKAIDKVCIFTSLNKSQAEDLEYKDLLDICNTIDTALNTDSEFQNRFKIGDVEFGFLTLDKVKGNEYIDLVNYSKNLDDVDVYHKLMSILFRPITDNGVGKTYRIEKYKGTAKYAELMKHTPLNVVDGALGFFLTLRNELQTYILKYTKEERARVTLQNPTSKSGVGLQV